MKLLSQKIREFQEQAILDNQLTDADRKIMEEETLKLKASQLSKKALVVGDMVGDFTLPNAENVHVSLAEILYKHDFAVISFYRGAWCPYCNLELRALQEINGELKAMNTKLIAISPMAPDDSLDLKEKANLDFEVLSDLGNVVARKFGLVFELPEVLRPIYKKVGIDIPASNRDASYELPIPGTFVLNRHGIVIFAFVDEDYARRCEPNAIIKIISDSKAQDHS